MMMQTSDMFKKIKSFFIVEEDGGQPAMASQENQSQTGYVPVTPKTSNSYTPSSENSSAGPDQKFTDLLLKAIEANNQEGFDYLEFKNSLKSIEGVIPDESMRYKSAFEMAKTMGLTKDKLVQSAGLYLNILANEDKKFKDAVENQKAKQIQGRTENMTTMEKSIADKQAMIENLQNEITGLKKQLEDFRNEINESAIKIDMTNQQFVASYNLVYGQIAADVEKIKANI